MQMVKKILFWIIAAWLAIIVFAPKRELYYMLEEELAKQDIILHGEAIEEGLLGLTVKHPTLYVNKIEAATIDEIGVTTLLLWNSVTVRGITVNSMAREWIPAPVDQVGAEYAVWAPKKVSLNGQSPFALIEPTSLIDLDGMKARVDIAAVPGNEKAFERLKGFLKKDEKGWYYETAL